MSWTLNLNLWKHKGEEDKKNADSSLSEEVCDIIERMPTAFGDWVAIAVIVFTVLLLGFGWMIKYPDAVTGKIKINSNVSPIRLVANTSGKIHLLGFKAQDQVKEGDYIAEIQNPADAVDIDRVMKALEQYNPNNKIALEEVLRSFPEQVSLGELNMMYYSFLSGLKDKYNYDIKNIYDQQKAALTEDIKWKSVILEQTGEILKITEENLKIAGKWQEKYTSLNKETVATYEQEVDKTSSEYLIARQNEQNLKKEMTSIHMQIAESRNKLEQLELEQQAKERQMQLELISAYNELHDNLKLWEQRYILKAPFSGKVEFLNFWTEGQYVQGGQDVFSVIPEENKVLGQMLLPASGAGKVKTGASVSIKLDDYPYTEYGSITGQVKSISLITQAYKNGNNSLETYLVIVDMPEGLTTNYGEKLDFKYEIAGMADIIIKDRRLIERLFDNLKSKTR